MIRWIHSKYNLFGEIRGYALQFTKLPLIFSFSARDYSFLLIMKIT